MAIYGVEGWSLRALAESPLLRRVDTWVMLDRCAGGDLHAYECFFRALVRSPARCYQQYGCPEGHLLHQLFHLADPGSRIRIELIQLDDLDRPNATTPGGWDKYEEAARCFNNHCRERIADVVRPAAGPFPLQGVLNKYLVAGHTRRGQPALAAVTDTRYWVIALFDAAGRLVGDEQHSAPKGFRPRSRFLVDELGFSPGLIRVRPFRWEVALELGLWTSGFAARYVGPFLDHWAGRGAGSGIHPGRAIRRWLAGGRFGLRWEVSPFEYAGDRDGGIEPAEA
ncbi:MAG TPA: hypothetical protein VD866_00535 [Urbifossiella sp.]|nr:hypothetical protein [Urbifossiella sp.]